MPVQDSRMPCMLYDACKCLTVQMFTLHTVARMKACSYKLGPLSDTAWQAI